MFERPLATSLIGRITDTNDTASELAVRIAVTGAEARSKDLNSPRGDVSLFFLIKKVMVARVNDTIYDIRTAIPAPYAPIVTFGAKEISITPAIIIVISSKSSIML